ncbi:hypothetical protein [Leptospira weilii]|uniref:Uncharacterized protein n=1 Tax=Leptospira weilii str. UI 13098 TaxID=1088542 RepID=M6QH04_9LEPT|nr:hypothetical protein [Leptospira weilii]EMN92540.1 hypothetical protein LEP1GSC108_0177 [Leptospira weilii str. UI 13098]
MNFETDKTTTHDSVSDRSENPATQHELNAKTGIYAKLEMLRCRLKRRARLCAAEPTPKVASVLRKTGSPLEKVKR